MTSGCHAARLSEVAPYTKTWAPPPRRDDLQVSLLEAVHHALGAPLLFQAVALSQAHASVLMRRIDGALFTVPMHGDRVRFLVPDPLGGSPHITSATLAAAKPSSVHRRPERPFVNVSLHR